MHKRLRGDTLIEILLATAIFSAAAVSVVGVMRHGLTQAQSSLEQTMALSEVDIQAEALRFIQDSYTADISSEFYTALWEKISSLANDPSSVDKSRLLTDYYSFSTPYDTGDEKNIYQFHPFIINTRFLSRAQSLYESSATPEEKLSIINSVVISYDNYLATPDQNPFVKAPVYPRIIYANSSSETDEDTLMSSAVLSSDYTAISAIEGIWIIAIRSTSDIDSTDFADFYIKTCWNSPDNSIPSQVSTTIRLSIPTELTTIDYIAKNEIVLVFHYPQGDLTTIKSFSYVAEGAVPGYGIEIPLEMAPTITLNDELKNAGYLFAGWGFDGENTINNIKSPDDTYLDWALPGLYCSESEYNEHLVDPGRFPSCQHTTINADIEEGTKGRTYIHFYAAIKRPVFVAILLDVSGSMSDDIKWFKKLVPALREEVYATGGQVTMYTLGGNKSNKVLTYSSSKTDCIDPITGATQSSCAVQSCSFDTCKDAGLFDSEINAAANIASGGSSSNPEYHGARAMLSLLNYLDVQIQKRHAENPEIVPLDAPRIIIYLTDTYASRSSSNSGNKSDLYNGYPRLYDSPYPPTAAYPTTIPANLNQISGAFPRSYIILPKSFTSTNNTNKHWTNTLNAITDYYRGKNILTSTQDAGKVLNIGGGAGAIGSDVNLTFLADGTLFTY